MSGVVFRCNDINHTHESVWSMQRDPLKCNRKQKRAARAAFNFPALCILMLPAPFEVKIAIPML